MEMLNVCPLTRDCDTCISGTLELCIRNLLVQCIATDKLFSIQILNERLTSFFYGPDVTNKPSTLSPHHISPSGHIKQSGNTYPKVFSCLFCYFHVNHSFFYSQPDVVSWAVPSPYSRGFDS